MFFMGWWDTLEWFGCGMYLFFPQKFHSSLRSKEISSFLSLFIPDQAQLRRISYCTAKYCHAKCWTLVFPVKSSPHCKIKCPAENICTQKKYFSSDSKRDLMWIKTILDNNHSNLAADSGHFNDVLIVFQTNSIIA